MVNDDWVAGYCATVTVTNLAAVDVTWMIEVEIEGTISSIWNAEATPTSGDWVQFNGVAWNAVLPLGLRLLCPALSSDSEGSSRPFRFRRPWC